MKTNILSINTIMKTTYSIKNFAMRIVTAVVLLCVLSVGNAWGDSATMAYSGGTTTNMTGSNDAATLGLPDGWSAVGAKGNNANYPGLNKSNYIALYYAATGSNTLTVTAPSGTTINSITITYTADTYNNGKVLVGGNVITISEGAYAINAQSFVITNGNTSNVQVRISSVVITYTTGGVPTYTVTYDANEGSGTMTDSNSPYDEDATVTVLSNTFTAPDGYVFDHWDTAADDSGTDYAPGATFTITANTTLYAQWVSAPGVNYVLTDISELTSEDVFIIVGNNGSDYALPNNGGASTPRVVSVTVTNDMINTAKTTILWNISGNASDGYTFYPNGTTETWLYLLEDNNNGVRIGTGEAKVFTINNGYLYTTQTTSPRYVGIYNSADWRCYTNTTGNIAGQTFAFYKREPELTFFRTKCYRVYNDGEADGLWSTEANWTNNRLPNIHDRADILKPVTVDIIDAKAKNVVLKQNTPNTGKLEISAGKALTVAETVQKTTDGSTLVATGENDIVFGSTLAAGTGALVAGGYTSGDNKATVNFAVKAKKDGSGHWINQYIGTPFNDQGAVLYNYYGTQLYAFHPTNDGNYDSGTGSANDAWWSRLAETDGMNPFVGYNILCSKAETPVLWMQGTLNASDNQTINGSKLVYNGTSNTENLLANSWMASIHIEAFENGDFSNVEKTIYIFNAGSPEDYASVGDGAASATAAGQYIVLPIASAPWVNPTVTVIPAMQAFSVYAIGANPSLTLDYNRLVYTPALTSVGVVPTRAPRRDKVAEDAPEVISLHVTAGSGYAANAYILGREDFADSFDDGWDGRFMEGDEAAPQLYAPTENGNLVINCVPNIEGTVVCFKRGSVDSEYTFTFDYEGEESWYLNDQKEQESTLISALDSYTFHSSADDMPARFVVSRTPIYKTPTGVENADGRNQKSDVRKIVIDDHVFIIRNGLMYDVTGALCK